MVKIQKYLNEQHKYKVDHTYQRPSNAWSNEDNQCLIDTILRGEPIPIFFLNSISKENIFYIVDGQQRLNAIKRFHENKLKLNGKFSGNENHGKTFNGDNALDDNQRSSFLEYDLNFFILEDYDDDRVRVIFSKLQRGKPLQLGERLNAKPGEIVEMMREIAEHPFMKKSIGINKDRYGNYPDAARILFYEKHKAKHMGSKEIYDFFDKNKDIDNSDKDFKNAISILDFLAKCFPPEPGEYSYIEKHAWVLAVYTMIRDLRVTYSLQNKESEIRKFVEDFHTKVYDEDFRRSNIQYSRFYDNIRGGWSEKIIVLRRDILIQEFLKKHKLEEFDDKRQISEEKKIEAFGRAGKKCELCAKELKDFREPEYHHMKRFADGGTRDLENISVLCKDCHLRVHGKEKIALPSETEIVETEEE